MVFLLIILLGLLADQLTKWLVVQHLPLGGGLDLLPPLLRLHHVQNTGAAWSLFSDSTLALAVFSLLLLAALGVWFALTPADRLGERLALSVIIAGALGNMVDRFRLGYVVDFLQLPHWPVFNVADMLLCLGVAALAWLLLRENHSLNQRVRQLEKEDKTGKPER